LAILYRRKGDFDRAERFFTRASESYRNSVYDESLVVAQRVTSRHPRNLRSQAQLAVVHLGLGDIQHSLGQEERARQAGSRALTTITPDTASTDVVDCLDTESRALLRLNRIDEARPIVDRLLAIGWCTPDFLDLCRQHGLATISDHGEDRPSDREER
ncbi:MAG: tetratricopeptide repeat protein, partial [bacterium]|nr:tetratricopeptide repeat protein [bacterium]